MRALLALLLFAPIIASAQSSASEIQAHANTVDVCDAWYPAAETPAAVDATTLLQVRIAADGTVHDPKLVTSSGFADFDAAAQECAGHAHMIAARLDRKPIEIVWQIAIKWRHDGHSYFGPPLSFDAAACEYPPLARRLNESGWNSVYYDIEADGSVSNVAIGQTSGYPDLDAVAVACTASRRYPPATIGSKPVRFEWGAAFNWRLAG
jgi:TonB family protein